MSEERKRTGATSIRPAIRGHMVLPMQATGEPLWWHGHGKPFPRNPGDPCVHLFYKDAKEIPDKYYDMVGMKKP